MSVEKVPFPKSNSKAKKAKISNLRKQDWQRERDK